MITQRHGYGWLIFGLVIMLLMLTLFNVTNAMAATFEGSVQLPTTRVDGSVLDITEIDSVTIECATADTGPFDAHTVTLTQISPVMTTSIEMPLDQDYWCHAIVTDTVGQVSDPSNVRMLDFVAAPGVPTLTEFNMVINLTITVPQ